MGIEAKTDNDKAKAKYVALKAECDAELANLDAINAQRQHEYEMNKASAFEDLADGRGTKIVMSGSAGDNLIDKIFKF